MSESTVLRATESRSGLDVSFHLLADKAPANVAFLRALLVTPRDIEGIHAMWTGPEISCPVPTAMVPPQAAQPLPAENATIHPQPGEVVLAYVPPRMWGGGPDQVFDIGLFYAPGARLLFPIGWLPGSVVARAAPDQLDSFAAACRAIRKTGVCTIRFSLT